RGADQAAGHRGERSVFLRDSKQQRDREQRDEQRAGEGREKSLGAPTRAEDRDDPAERDRQQPHIDPRCQADANDTEQRDEREHSGTYGHGGSSCFCTLPRAVRGRRSTRTNARGILKEARTDRNRFASASSSNSGPAATYAIGTSPRTGSGAPTTTASRPPGAS